MKTNQILAGAALVALASVVFNTRPAAAQSGGFTDVPKTHWAAQSITGLATAGILAPQSGTAKQTYNGDRPVTRYELAVTLYKFVQYMERADKQPRGKMKVEAPVSGPDAVKKLIAGGYLPANTVLAKEGGKNVTANQLADAMGTVITKIRAKKVPITPDSLRTQPIEHPPHENKGA
jgi:hypothetical protein